MTNAPTTTAIEKIVALGGGFSEYKQPLFADERATNVVLGTLNEPVAITYNGSDPTDPKPALIIAIEYSVQRSGVVNVSLCGRQIGQRINPSAVLGVSWGAVKA